MTLMLAIVPSRGRPGNISDLMQAFTATGARCDLLVAVDADDPLIAAYQAVVATEARSFPGRAWMTVAPRNGWAPRLSAEAVEHAAAYDAVYSLGDDHIPRTPGWDARLLDALDHVGLAYGNDLIHGAALPTACAVTTNIVTALGWMAPPALGHLYVDNAWLALGQALDAITYLDDVVVEHMHPIAGKADWDATYEAANSGAHWEGDSAAFERWRVEDLPGIVDTLKGLR